MKIQMLKGKIGVIKIGKSSKQDGLFVMPDVTDSLGIIKYVGEGVNETLTPGTKVYYGKDREECRMREDDVMIMEEDNIFAILEESNEEDKISKK